MNIIVFNTAIGTSNLGDNIINNCAMKCLQPLLQNAFVMEYASHLNNLGIFHYMTRSNKVRFAEKCNYKFVLGTNLLTTNLLRSIRQWPVGLVNRKLYKDCILMGVGTTFQNTKMDVLSYQMYEQILSKNVAHSVRDEEARVLLQSIKGVSAINTGCPTLWNLTEEVCSKIPTAKAKNAVLSLSGYKSQQNKEKDQKLIDIVEAEYEKIYFWMQTIDDKEYLKSFKHKKNMEIVYSLDQFSDICLNADVDYIGTRLHGGVFAMQHYVRSIIIEIDHRAIGFRKNNNIVTLNRDKIDELNEMIHSNIKTEVYIREKEINEWKKQFPFL